MSNTEKEFNKEQLQKDIYSYKKQGLGSRKIASLLGLSKSSVNNYYNEYLSNNPDKVVKPKLLLLDIETSPSIAAVFGRRKQNISQDAVLQEGGWLISYSYKWLGEDEVHGDVVTPHEATHKDDMRLCMNLWELIEQANALVYHNGINFDLPMIKTRMIVNALPPIRKIKSIDTYQLSKEFRFNSNKLDSLGEQLSLGRKIKHEGMLMWIKCLEGDTEALRLMLEYNKQDVALLEEIYLALAPYSTRHPNLSVELGDKIRCNICCSDNVHPTGNTVTTNLSVFEEYACQCGARFKTRKAITTKSQRSNFLVN